MKITKEYLLSLGFKECPTAAFLPDWYISFLAKDKIIESDSMEYNKDGYVVKIYFSPIGLIGECCEDDVSRPNLTYFKLVNEIDLFHFFDENFNIQIPMS